MGRLLCPALLFLVIAAAPLSSEGFASSFNSLAGWRLVNFEDDLPPTRFRSIEHEEQDVLRVVADGGASMIIRETPIDVYETPIVSWRWKLVEPLDHASLRSLFSEDTSIRVLILFRDELENLPWWLRGWARRQEQRHGELPPTSALNYVWATSDYGEEPFASLYSRRIQFYVKDFGEADLGSWQNHQVNIVEDYRRALGDDPPAEAFIAIMSDADNTDGYSEALVEYLRVSATRNP
jgi:hypothetical protein